jgi:hypothetical protein
MFGNNPHLYRHNRRLATPVAAKYHRALNALFCGLKEIQTDLSEVSQMCVVMDTSANTLKDISTNENDPTLFGTPTFTADQGYSNLDSTNYIKSGIDEYTDPNFSHSQHFIYGWLHTAMTPGNYVGVIGGYKQIIGSTAETRVVGFTFAVGPTFARIDGYDSSYHQLANTNGRPRGMQGLQRVVGGSSNLLLHDGVVVGAATASSVASASAVEIIFGTLNTDGTMTGSYYAPGTMSSWGLGKRTDTKSGTISTTRFAAFGNAVERYMDLI